MSRPTRTREQAREYMRAYRQTTSGAAATARAAKTWRERNPEAQREATRRRVNERYANDPEYAESVRRRSRRRMENPEFRERARAAAKERYTSNRTRIQEIKLERGCADCGYRECAEALHFDHLPGFEKCFDVGRGVTRPWEVIEAEIAKCEVVCANCHAKRTAERRKETQCRSTK